MMGGTHQLIGAAAGVSAGQALGFTLPQTAALTVGTYLSSLGPDDAEMGGLLKHRRLTHSPLAVGAFCVAVALAAAHFAATIKLPPVLALMVNAASAAGSALGDLPLLAAAGLGFGYAMHLAADACTRDGIRLLYPLSGAQVWLLPKPLRVRTGERSEAVAASLVAVTLVAYLSVAQGIV